MEGRRESKLVKQFRLGQISISAFQTEDGIHFARPERRYKDKETGEYKNGETFFAGDLANLAALATSAINWVIQQERPRRSNAEVVTTVPLKQTTKSALPHTKPSMTPTEAFSFDAEESY